MGSRNKETRNKDEGSLDRSRFEDIEDVVDLTHCLNSASAQQSISSPETSKWKCSSDEESDSSSGDEAFRVTEYYKAKPKLPVYTKKTEVLGPLRVVKLLRSVGTSLPISVACIQ